MYILPHARPIKRISWSKKNRNICTMPCHTCIYDWYYIIDLSDNLTWKSLSLINSNGSPTTFATLKILKITSYEIYGQQRYKETYETLNTKETFRTAVATCQPLTVSGPRQTLCPWTGLGRATPVYSSGNVSLGWPLLFSVSRLVTSSGWKT